MEPCKTWWGSNHSWNNWEQVEEGEVVKRLSPYSENDKRVIGKYYIQQRDCSKCGLIDKRLQKINLDYYY